MAGASHSIKLRTPQKPQQQIDPAGPGIHGASSARAGVYVHPAPPNAILSVRVLRVRRRAAASPTVRPHAHRYGPGPGGHDAHDDVERHQPEAVQGHYGPRVPDRPDAGSGVGKLTIFCCFTSVLTQLRFLSINFIYQSRGGGGRCPTPAATSVSMSCFRSLFFLQRANFTVIFFYQHRGRVGGSVM